MLPFAQRNPADRTIRSNPSQRSFSRRNSTHPRSNSERMRHAVQRVVGPELTTSRSPNPARVSHVTPATSQHTRTHRAIQPSYLVETVNESLSNTPAGSRHSSRANNFATPVRSHNSTTRGPTTTNFQNVHATTSHSRSVAMDVGMDDSIHSEGPSSYMDSLDHQSAVSVTPSEMVVYPFEPDFSDFTEWLFRHFGHFLKLTREQVDHMVTNKLGLISDGDLIAFGIATPAEVVKQVGEDFYQQNCHALAELMIIVRCLLKAKNWEAWHYVDFLTAREECRDAIMATFVPLHSLPGYSTLPASTSPKPPPYTAMSPVVRELFGKNYVVSPPAIPRTSSPVPSYNLPRGGFQHSTQMPSTSQPEGTGDCNQRDLEEVERMNIPEEEDVVAPQSTSLHSLRSHQRKMRSLDYTRLHAAAKARSQTSSDKLRWNGEKTTFRAFTQDLEGTLIRLGVGYLFEEYTIQKWKEYGNFEFAKEMEFWDMFQISYNQVIADSKYLYGILLSATKGRVDPQVVMYKKGQNGLAAWLHMKGRHLHEGTNTETVLLTELENKMMAKYDNSKHKSLLAYLDKFYSWAVQLDGITQSNYKDSDKKRLLLRALESQSQIAHLLNDCRNNLLWTFEECLTHLSDRITESESLQVHKPLRPQSTMLKTEAMTVDAEAPSASPKMLDLDETLTLVQKMSSESSLTHVFNALQSSSMRESLRIPTEIWVKLEPKLKDRLTEIKKEIYQQRKKQDSSNKDEFPAQYTKKALKTEVETAESIVDAISQINISDMDVDTDDEELQGNLFMVRSMEPELEAKNSTIQDSPDLEVRAHFEHGQTFQNHGKVYMIADGGADSTVLGSNAVIKSYSGRYANLVGYDPSSTRSAKVPIVSAYVKVKAHNGIPVLLLIHEAPFMKDNPFSLLSEYQVREHGYVIDSVASKHMKTQDSHGTQRFELNDVLHIPFEDRGGIMGFEMMTVEDGDIDEVDPIFDVFEITSSQKWQPQRFRINHQSLEPPGNCDHIEASEDTQQNTSETPLLTPYEAQGELLSSEDQPEYLKTHLVDAVLDTFTYDELVGTWEYNSEYFGLPPLEEPDPEGELHAVMANFVFAPSRAANIRNLSKKPWHRIHYPNVDPQKLRKYLGYRPVDIILKTLQHTTQAARTVMHHPLRRHVKARNEWCNVTRLDEVVSTDSVFSNCASIDHGFHGFQAFFGHTSHSIDVYGFHSKGEFPRIYKDFIREQGAPSILRRDNAKEEKSNEVQDIQRRLLIKDQFSEPYNQQQNLVESCAVRWLKQSTHVLMDKTGAPESIWYLAVKYMADLHDHLYDKTLNMTPKQMRNGRIPELTPFLQFSFWEPVLYLDQEESWPYSKERAGRWVGVSHNVGDILTYWILDDQSKRILPRSVVRPFHSNRRAKWDPAFATTPDKHTAQHGGDVMPAKQLRDSLLDSAMDPFDKLEPEPSPHPICVTDWPTNSGKTQPASIHQDQPVMDDPGVDYSKLLVPLKDPDPYSGKSLLKFSNKPMEEHPDIKVYPKKGRLPQKEISYPTTFVPEEVDPEGHTQKTKTWNKPNGKKGRKLDMQEDLQVPFDRGKTDSEMPPKQDQNPRRSERIAKTKWVPGTMKKIFGMSVMALGTLALPTHIVAEPSHGLVDHPDTSFLFPDPASMTPLEQGRNLDKMRAYHATLDRWNAIQDPSSWDAQWTVVKIIQHSIKELPKGRSIMFKGQYIGGDKAWFKMDTLRIDDPHLVINYAFQHDLQDLQDFQWIQDYVDFDPTCERMVRANKTSLTKGKKYKFGIEVPRNPLHAFELDKENGNSGWRDSIGKELGQIRDYEVFKVWPDDKPLPPGYKRIPYHIVFDVKFDGRLKSRLVAGGHRSPDVPREDVFSGVASMEAVRLGFLLAKMNGLKVCAGDVGNAFLYGSTKEKVYVIAGPEFGPELEGKRMLIDKSLYGLKTSSARFHEHLSVKLKKMGFKPSKADPDLWMRFNKLHDCYEYIARYVDDVIAFAKDPLGIMKELEKHYIMKGVGKPMYYLGGDVIELDEAWGKEGLEQAFSAETYLKNCLPKLSKMLNIEKFITKRVPLDPNYHPELDESPLLGPEKTSQYRSLIGSLNWILTLGRFDVAYAFSTMARYMMAPREGHLSAVKNIFGYLAKYPKGQLIVDPGEPPVREKLLLSSGHNWSEFYPDACEDVPRDQPAPRGSEAKLTCYVDADHARDKLTRRSVTGIVLLVNNTPLTWLSKRQKTVETSTYGSELVASRIAVDLLVEWRYKLRMLGVVLENVSYLVGDNMSVILNTTLPSSSLKKKHLACAYHRVREAIAGRFITFGHCKSEENMADICTKPLGPTEFHRLANQYLFRQSKVLSAAKQRINTCF